MKKYLMTGVAALAICAAFTSCSKSEELFNQGAIDQQKGEKVAQSYNEAFVQVFGKPAADQDWGFNSDAARRAGTRAATRGTCGECYKFDMQYDTPSFPKTGHPAAISDSERDYVKAWFSDEANRGLSERGLDISDFYIQHVWGQANKNYNVIKEDGSVEVNQATMDYCEVGDGTNYTHLLDFNSNSGGPYNIVYMRNSSALSFGFHATWGDNRDYHNFKLAHIVGTAEDGTKIDGYYVGLAMWGQKWDNGTKTLNGDEWDIADDWILKIVPGEGTITPPDDPNYTIRVIGEDLTFGEDDELSLDFDFNDVVFDVALNVPGKTYIKVKAAGGTLPLIIGVANPDNAQSYDDNEIHHILGYSDTSIMINTNAASKGLRGGSAEDGILILNTAYNNAREIPVFVKKNGVWCELAATAGEPASKIGISNMNFRWCDERTSMKGTYPFFADWVQATAEFRGTIVWW